MTDPSMTDTVWELDPAGPLLGSEADALDIVGNAYAAAATLVVIPVARLAPGFFRLRTGIAGAFIQKLVNYRLRLAIVGDVTDHVNASTAFRDYVTESNRGRQVWFVADRAELDLRRGQ